MKKKNDHVHAKQQLISAFGPQSVTGCSTKIIRKTFTNE